VKFVRRMHGFADRPVVQLRQNTRRNSGDVGSIPTGAPISMGRGVWVIGEAGSLLRFQCHLAAGFHHDSAPQPGTFRRS
jgi:hypothetical protein